MFDNSGVKNGIYLGVATVLFSFICYLINPKWMITGVAYFIYVIILFFMYKSAVDERKLNNGILRFSEALKVTFLTYVIGGLFGAIYVYIMYNFVDENLIEITKEVQLNQAEMVGNFFGIEDQIEDLPEQLDQQELKMSFNLVFMNYLVSLIFPGFIFAMIMSAITKKEPAEERLVNE